MSHNFGLIPLGYDSRDLYNIVSISKIKAITTAFMCDSVHEMETPINLMIRLKEKLRLLFLFLIHRNGNVPVIGFVI